MPTHTGHCHCGAVRFTLDAELEKFMRCNCSFCARAGLLWFFTPATNLSIEGEENLKDYQFGDKTLHHRFCTTCGIRPFSTGAGHDGTAWAGINIGCIDGLDINTLDYVKNDGASR